MEVLSKKNGRILNEDGSVTFLEDYRRVNRLSFFDDGKMVILRGTAPSYVYNFTEKDVVEIKKGETVSEIDMRYKNVKLVKTPPVLEDARSAAAIKEDLHTPWGLVNWIMNRINL